MIKYLFRRVLGAIIVMWAVATLVFFMLRLVPGDPLAAMLYEVDPEVAEIIREQYGLDRPIHIQYGIWLSEVMKGNLGRSIYGSRIDVSRIVGEAFPRTMSIAFCPSPWP